MSVGLRPTAGFALGLRLSARARGLSLGVAGSAAATAVNLTVGAHLMRPPSFVGARIIAVPIAYVTPMLLAILWSARLRNVVPVEAAPGRSLLVPRLGLVAIVAVSAIAASAALPPVTRGVSLRNALFLLGLTGVSTLLLDGGQAWLVPVGFTLFTSVAGARSNGTYAPWALLFRPAHDGWAAGCSAAVALLGSIAWCSGARRLVERRRGGSWT